MKAQEPIRHSDSSSASSHRATNGESLEQKSNVKLDMFLPMLFEHPNKSAAWRIGVPFRNAAYSLAMCAFNDSDCFMLEHKRTGQEIKAREVKILASTNAVHEQLIDWIKYIRSALEVAKDLGEITRWRFLIMQLTLGELNQEGKGLPYVTDVLHVVNGGLLRDWDLVHLSARYQAEYYSLKMLKDVLGWFKTIFRLNGIDMRLYRMDEGLRDLPRIADFFEKADPGISQEQWQALEVEFREKEEARASPQ